MNASDTFEKRRQALSGLSDEQIKERFWNLADQVVTPLVELAREHTSPAIERSVLMRMGFSSLESKAITDKIIEAHLLGHGAGHVVLRAAQKWVAPYPEAGRKIAAGAEIKGLF